MEKYTVFWEDAMFSGYGAGDIFKIVLEEVQVDRGGAALFPVRLFEVYIVRGRRDVAVVRSVPRHKRVAGFVGEWLRVSLLAERVIGYFVVSVSKLVLAVLLRLESPHF